MNANLTLSPLPESLRQPRRNGSARRQRIGDYQIDPDALRHFNELLERLDLSHPPLDSDQVASAARELVDQPHPARAPPCILQRVRRGAAIDMMLADPDWDTDARRAEVAAIVASYMRGNHELIPNQLPVVGRLDDAILVEESWPSLAQEVADYLDFCRLRHIEAALRGEDRRRRFGFTREQWRNAAAAERAWVEHIRRVDTVSYLPSDPVPRFRVN